MTGVQTCALPIFFFFKEKTAYEIVDCDWGSDVCSSDLWELSLAGKKLSQKDFEKLVAQETPLIEIDRKSVV